MISKGSGYGLRGRIGVVAALVLVLVAQGASAEKVYKVSGRGVEAIYDTAVDVGPLVAKAGPDKVLKANLITFNITYLDPANQGFNDPTLGPDRKARVEDALEYVGAVLAMAGTLDVTMEVSENDGAGGLAYGGTYFTADEGWTNGTMYERLSTGSKPLGSYPELFVKVDWGHNWYLGTGTPAFSEYDFFSVMIHEFTHSSGFLSLANSNGSSGIASGVYSVYDNYLYTGNGTDLFAELGQWDTPTFMGTALDLTGWDGGVVFTGPQATAAYGTNPTIYTPDPWQSGSSLSHWDSGSISGGAVMYPGLFNGAVQRQYADVEIAALRDLGYANAAEPETTYFVLVSGGGFFEEGDSHTLEAVLVGGVGNVSYQWFKDGSPVAGATGTQLALTDMTVDDTGVYVCQATDEGTKAIYSSPAVYVRVLLPGELPAAGMLALTLLGVAAALSGTAALRRKR